MDNRLWCFLFKGCLYTVAVIKKFTFSVLSSYYDRSTVRPVYKNGERTDTRRAAESAFFRRDGRQSLECGCYTRRHGSYWLFANTSRQVGPCCTSQEKFSRQFMRITKQLTAEYRSVIARYRLRKWWDVRASRRHVVYGRAKRRSATVEKACLDNMSTKHRYKF